MKFQNEKNGRWPEPLPCLTDNQFVALVLTAAAIIVAIIFYYRYNEIKETDNPKTPPAYKSICN